MTLLSDCRRLGIEVAVREGHLMVRDPRGQLTPELRAALRSERQELATLVTGGLETYPCQTCGRFSFHLPAPVCYWCRTQEGKALCQGQR